MIVRRRFLLLALSILFVLPALISLVHAEGKVDSEILVPLPSYSLSGAVDDAEAQAPPCGLKYQWSERCAQWKAAEAAEDAVQWNARSFYVSVATTIVGALTLGAAIAAAMYARAAAGEARRSADAALDAVSTTRNIGEAQTRAYLFLRSAKYHLSNKAIIISIDIGNTGQSPATNVVYDSTLRILDIGGIPSHPRVLFFVSSEKESGSVQPVNSNGFSVEEVHFWWGVNIPEEKYDIEKYRYLFTGGNAISFDLEVRWRDVFGVTHRFTAYLDAEVGPTPTNRRVKRSLRGELEIRANDPEHRLQRETLENL